nr:cation:dicarboxylase symporter family transporter [Fructobacillus fructosus]
MLFGLAALQKKGVSFNRIVLLGLALGITFGIVTQIIWGTKNQSVLQAVDWINIVGNGYLALLQVLVAPLILISIIAAFTKLNTNKNFLKITLNVLLVLLGTTAIAALIGILSVSLFHLKGTSFINHAANSDTLAVLNQKQSTLTEQTVPQKIVSFLPKNIFADLSASRVTSTIAIVIFSFFVGLAYLQLRKENTKLANSFAYGIDVIDGIITKLVRIIISLTPYGIFSLMTKTVAISSLKTITSLGIFIITVYFALVLVLVVHTVLLILNHINPIIYYQKVWPALIFAFTSRSSAGVLPLNIDIQKNQLGVNPGIADFSASFGLSIGQNGCAGVYPAILAAISATLSGTNILSLQFVITLVAVVTVASFGVAGSGGGATFASLIVLGTLNLPLSIMALVIAVDPIVDMGRTLVNVNDSIIAGLLTAKHNHLLDTKVLAESQSKSPLIID